MSRSASSNSKKQASKVAVEDQKVKRIDPSSGVAEVVPLLDRVWVKEVNFLPFAPPTCLPPPGEGGGGGRSLTVDPLWLECTEMLDGDLHWLLQLPYHKFWSQVMFDESLHKSLDSYLCSAMRVCAELTAFPLDVQELIRNLHRRVFMVFLRMSLHKEDGNFMSQDTFGSILYNHFLLDLPKLLDLCVLYGPSNRQLLTRMVANVFGKQPKYEEDWRVMVGVAVKTLTEVADRVRSGEGERGVVRLDRAHGLPPSDFAEVVLYLADFAGSLRNFLTIRTEGCQALMDAGFVSKVASFYEGTVTNLQESWHRLRPQLSNQGYLKECLRALKRDLAWLAHEVLQVCYVTPKPLDSSEVRGKTSLEGFISVVSDLSGEKRFLREYNKQFNLTEEVKMVQQAHPELPDTHFDYIISALMEDPTHLPEPTQSSTQTPPGRLPGTSRDSKAGASRDSVPGTSRDSGVTQSLISHVKDLLPFLGEGFIELCLREFDNDPEVVINRILEGTLPPHLRDMDSTLPSRTPETTPHAPPPATGGVESEWPHLEQRESVFDNDEFDVFRRPGQVDLSRVHIGKKFDSSSVASVLDDKSHLTHSRDRYRAYEIETPWDYLSEDQAASAESGGGDCGLVGGAMYPVSGVTGMEPGFDVLYDDEYDDTYDSQNVGAADDATDEEFVVKRLNEKGLFARQLNRQEENKVAAPPPLHDLSSERSRAKEFVRDFMKNDKVGMAARGRGGGEEGRRPKGEGKPWRKEEWSEGRRGEWSEGRRGEWSEGRDWKGSGRPPKQDRKGRGQEAGGEHQKRQQNGPRPAGGGTREMQNSAENSTGNGPSPPRVRGDQPKGTSGGRGQSDAARSRGPAHHHQHDEQRARQLKDRHKNSQANHSRKALADKKRRGGML